MDRQLLQEIKKQNVRPVYFFYGSETFLIEETVEWMRNQLMPGEDQFGNVTTLDLEEVPVQILVQEAETPPFFGDRRLIIGKNAGFLSTAKKRGGVDHKPETLLSYLEQPLASNVVILVAPSDQLDKRKKVVKALEKQAYTMKFEPLKGSELLHWLQKRLKQMGVDIEKEALRELVQLAGTDLRLLYQECVKLATFVGKGGTVTPSVVSELVPRTLEHDVFKLTDSIARRKIDEAFSIWYDLLYQREEPVRILALITRQFRLMLQVKILARQGMSEKEMASHLKVHPYPVKLALRQSAAFSEEALRSLLARAIAADQEMKSGKIDKVLAVERLLLQVNIPA
ncbi:DNA polymerase III subunit delta [Paenactinomyces guangxiensis]|uniref:DNA polymerase III subunit delta n=1 Tax=Paenactinomyces guangxiensis TaxID=1490290 RepID=A0A7W1WND6_9BACL|nr:DNA polymerase III subunit delta [Paenactinomyces guangxiensis]MBA4493105.1 DNA polymerase III subunit delta [Paenactinomyces guangxiensis]MBH8590045.1 DNA polymerase III subunit delta [Paenactinomyces guangxiensis]